MRRLNCQAYYFNVEYVGLCQCAPSACWLCDVSRLGVQSLVTSWCRFYSARFSSKLVQVNEVASKLESSTSWKESRHRLCPLVIIIIIIFLSKAKNLGKKIRKLLSLKGSFYRLSHGFTGCAGWNGGLCRIRPTSRFIGCLCCFYKGDVLNNLKIYRFLISSV